ncbi:hypothetical protein ACTXT7_016486 [Hymenolepis weldensis]
MPKGKNLTLVCVDEDSRTKSPDCCKKEAFRPYHIPMDDGNDTKIDKISEEELANIFIQSQLSKDNVSPYHAQLHKSADEFFKGNFSESGTHVNNERVRTKSQLNHGGIVCFEVLQGSFVRPSTRVSSLKSDFKNLVNIEYRDATPDFKLSNNEYGLEKVNLNTYSDNSKENFDRISKSKNLQNSGDDLTRRRKRRPFNEIQVNGSFPPTKRKKILDELTDEFPLDSSNLNTIDISERAHKTITMSQVEKRLHFKCPRITKIARCFDYDEEISKNEYDLTPKNRLFSPFPLPRVKGRKTDIEEIDKVLSCDMNLEISYSEDFYAPNIKCYQTISSSSNSDLYSTSPTSTIAKTVENDGRIPSPVHSDTNKTSTESKETVRGGRVSLRGSPYRKKFSSLQPTSTQNSSRSTYIKEIKRASCTNKTTSRDSNRISLSSMTCKSKSSRKISRKRIQKYEYPYCAAKICLMPAGATIEWICCDTCEKCHDSLVNSKKSQGKRIWETIHSSQEARTDREVLKRKQLKLPFKYRGNAKKLDRELCDQEATRSTKSLIMKISATVPNCNLKLFSNRNELLTYPQDVKEEETQIGTQDPHKSLLFNKDLLYFPPYSSATREEGDRVNGRVFVNRENKWQSLGTELKKWRSPTNK